MLAKRRVSTEFRIFGKSGYSDLFSLSLQAPQLMWESVCTDVRAAVDTAISTAEELSHAMLLTSFTLPQTPAWAVCGKSEFGMTTKVLINSEQ